MPGSGDARPRPHRAEPSAPDTPLINARLDGRHVGAVTKLCLHEAAHSRPVQVDPTPKTFAHPARADGEAGQQ